MWNAWGLTLNSMFSLFPGAKLQIISFSCPSSKTPQWKNRKKFVRRLLNYRAGPKNELVCSTNRSVANVIKLFHLFSYKYYNISTSGQFNKNSRVLIYNAGQCYKTFFGRKLRLFVISQSICPWHAFPAQSNVWGEPIRVKQAPGLTHKHQNGLKRLARDKCSGLLQKFSTYGRKKSIAVAPVIQSDSTKSYNSSIASTKT